MSELTVTAQSLRVRRPRHHIEGGSETGLVTTYVLTFMDHDGMRACMHASKPLTDDGNTRVHKVLQCTYVGLNANDIRRRLMAFTSAARPHESLLRIPGTRPTLRPRRGR